MMVIFHVWNQLSTSCMNSIIGPIPGPTDFQIGMKDRSFLDLDIEGTNDPKHECK